ncbi:unnamed protein product [Rotaria magnacalcarata]|uniref:Uncharacterized protein n=1 Tax=Rotaria magnacalcarata TaxID=392030 RepID=A0A816P5Z9_9BILA|nr:unnamed protein product [Rotaria magnacalcarata]CAF4197775.1 unnamed protein product [Rotaria magnacalcarata]
MDSQTSQEFIEPPPTNPGPQTFRPQTPQIIPEVEIPPARTPRPTFFPSEGQFPPMGTEGSTVINNLIHQLNMSAKKAVQQDQAQGGIEPPPSTKIKKRTIAEVKAEAARKAREKRAANALLVKQKKEEEQEKRRRRWEERQKENEEESQTEEDNRRTTQAERETILQRAQKFAQDQQEINMQLEAEFTALQQEHVRKIAIQEQELQAEQRKLLDNINKAQSDLQIKMKKRQQEILLAKAHADKETQHNENIRVEIRNKNEAMDYYHSLDTVDQQKIADLMAKYKFTFLTISAYNLVQIFKQVQSEGSDPDTNVKKEVVPHKQKTDPLPKLNLDDDQSDDQSQVLTKKIKISKNVTPKQTPKSNPPKGSRDSIVGGSMLRAARNKNKITISDDTDEKLSQETCDRLQHMLSMIDSSDEFSEFYDQLSSYLNVVRDGKRNIPDKDISFFKFSGETLNQFLDYLEKYHKYAIANFQPQEYRFITVLARFVEKGVLKNCIDTLEFDNITYMDMLLSIFTIWDENIVKVKSRKDAFETLAKIEGEEAMHLVTRIRNSYQYAFPGSIIEHDKRAIAKVMEFLNPDLRKELKRELALHMLITRNPISNIKLLSTKSCFNQNNIPSNKKVAFDTKLSIVCGFDSRDNAAALSKKASEKILPLKYKFNKINSKAISEKGDRTKTRPVYVKTIPTNTPSGLTVKQSEIYLNTLFNNLNKEIRDEYIDLTESEISEINELNSITERNSKYNQADTFINSCNVASGPENEASVLSNEEEVSTNQPTVPIEEIRYAGPMIQDTKISENSTSVMLDAFQHLYDYI